ncbi:MAG: hypothetical protein JSU65_14275 [Candidatus Zixiibacteriota bacterium]|nr:MAG: hypothetical protein JSU65_14275 [candidate division Zixibacteria bacterium]
MFRIPVLLAVAILAGLAVGAVAGEGHDRSEVAKSSAKAEHVTLQGTLECLGCDLKSQGNARAACSIYGHKHALKTEDGRYINFLENKYSEALLKGEKLHGKKLEVHGVYFANANLMDVEAYESEDNRKISWCSHCNRMDACSASK